MPQLLPEILNVRRINDTQIVLDLHVLPTLAYFPGHFPSLPILPGVVQIDWVVRLANKYLALEGSFTQLENIKFQALLPPDTRVDLALEWHPANGRLEFSFESEKRKYSSGRIVFGSAA